MCESTALGAAIAAGLAVGLWKDLESAAAAIQDDIVTFSPQITPEARLARYELWNRAVRRSAGWLERDD